MPVVGHAFVGLATGLVTRPRGASAWTSALWVPGMVALAYLPDISDQMVLLLGWGYRPSISHSLMFLAISSAVVGIPLARTMRSRYRRGMGVVLFSVAAHLALDVMQSPKRTPFWPFRHDAIRVGGGVLPIEIVWEGLLFGAMFGVFMAVRFVLRGIRGPGIAVRPAATTAAMTWCGRAVVGLLMSLAVVTHLLKHARAKDLQRAKTMNVSGEFHSALAMLDRADRWPAPFSPGQVDFWRARVWRSLGDRKRTEDYLLRSLEDAPGYYYTIANLAVFYASSDDPVEDRRRRVRPYVVRLRTYCAGHPKLGRLRRRLEHWLGEPVDLPVAEEDEGYRAASD